MFSVKTAVLSLFPITLKPDFQSLQNIPNKLKQYSYRINIWRLYFNQSVVKGSRTLCRLYSPDRMGLQYPSSIQNPMQKEKRPHKEGAFLTQKTRAVIRQPDFILHSSACYAVFKLYCFVNTLIKQLAYLTVFIERKTFKCFTALYAKGYNLARCLVCISERKSL